MIDLTSIAAVLERVRRERPLVHVITNFVTMNIVADALQAIGARPVMAFASEEVVEIAASARALVLNLGTPAPERLHAMRLAAESARAVGIPIVLDPVGVGASRWRTSWAMQFLANVRVDVVRGNSGEIAALTGRSGTVSGVDTIVDDLDPATEAHWVARRWNTTVASTGASDWICNETRVVSVQNGHPLLRAVTGSGDIASALIGACLAVDRDAPLAAASGLIALGLAGEHAGAEAHGPGTFRAALMDGLFSLNAQQVTREGRIAAEDTGVSPDRNKTWTLTTHST